MLADRIVVMNEGRIVQVGDPITVYNQPINRFVAAQIGSPKMNFFPSRLEVAACGALVLRLDAEGVLPVPESRRAAYQPYLDKSIELGIRPNHLSVANAGGSGIAGFDATIDVVEVTGAGALAFFTFGGVEAAAQCLPRDLARTGQPARIVADMDNMHLIETDSGRVVPVGTENVVRETATTAGVG